LSAIGTLDLQEIKPNKNQNKKTALKTDGGFYLKLSHRLIRDILSHSPLLKSHNGFFQVFITS
jgi:hypothetical protein